MGLCARAGADRIYHPLAGARRWRNRHDANLYADSLGGPVSGECGLRAGHPLHLEGLADRPGVTAAPGEGGAHHVAWRFRISIPTPLGDAVTWQIATIDTGKRMALAATPIAPVALLAVDARYWLTIAGGLMVGLMARYAVMLSLNLKVGWREIRIDALVLLANGLLTVQFAELFGLHEVRLAVAASMFGASSTMIFSKLHSAFVERASRMPTIVFAGPDSTTTVPASAPAVEVHAVPDDTDPVRSELRRAFPKPETSDPKMDELMKRLGEEPSNDY
jgi:hypothetical protein